MAGLTDTQIKRAKPKDAAYRLTDWGGLVVFVPTTGAKVWRWRYRYNGKEQTLNLGSYPEVSLAEARRARDEAKEILRSGRDPGLLRKIEKLVGRREAAETFEVIAREWHELQRGTWVPRHASDVLTSLERDVFPALGDLPIREIDAPTVLAVLRLVEKRDAKETARRLRQRMSAVFVYAIATGRGQDDPAAIVMKAMAPKKKGKQPAITDLDGARAMLRRIEATPSHPVTKLGIRLLALTAVRPGALETTPWEELNGVCEKNNIWLIPAQRMKLKLHHKEDYERDHLVPLSTQALDTIRVLRTLTGRGPYVLPNGRHASKPMSSNAMGYLINRAGYHHKHVPHGFRSTFSTVMNELYPADRFVIDRMLAHVAQNEVEGAYNRAQHMQRRAELAQLWADIILKDAPPASALLEGPRKILKGPTD